MPSWCVDQGEQARPLSRSLIISCAAVSVFLRGTGRAATGTPESSVTITKHCVCGSRRFVPLPTTRQGHLLKLQRPPTSRRRKTLLCPTRAHDGFCRQFNGLISRVRDLVLVTSTKLEILNCSFKVSDHLSNHFFFFFTLYR